jgi:ABC-type phosphate/phosphonate transport system ATPase subunit
MWEREAEFKQLLSKCSSKASKSAIDSLTQLAIEDHALVRPQQQAQQQQQQQQQRAALLHTAYCRAIDEQSMAMVVMLKGIGMAD